MEHLNKEGPKGGVEEGGGGGVNQSHFPARFFFSKSQFPVLKFHSYKQN